MDCPPTRGTAAANCCSSGSRAIDGGSGALKRNGTPAGRYAPDYAQQAAHSRRWRGARLERDAALRERVLAGFARRWSPQQIAERLAWESGRRVLCHESIYRFVYRQQARVKDYRWSRCLPQGKTKRGWRGRGRSSSARFIAHRTPIHQRPVAVATRETFGHWEADLMSFGRSGPVVLALHERASRLLVAVRQESKRADATAATLERLLGALPPAWRQTLTFDNGTEFARHYRLHALGIQTFFCDTHSPWQKGGVENAIGRLRRPLPRSTNLEAAFTAALQHNNTPRKCLGYRTPAEVFHDQVLHFKCESTISRPRERRWGPGDFYPVQALWSFPLSSRRAVGVAARRPPKLSRRVASSLFLYPIVEGAFRLGGGGGAPGLRAPASRRAVRSIARARGRRAGRRRGRCRRTPGRRPDCPEATRSVSARGWTCRSRSARR